jgi:hypothetical protein
VDDVEIISVDGSNLIFKGFRYENLYFVDFNLVKLNCQHVCSLSLAWVGCGIEGLVILE